jgi:hypothetical protein
LARSSGAGSGGPIVQALPGLWVIKVPLLAALSDEILAALIAHVATVIDAAMKEGANAAETTEPAEETEHPLAEGAPELP